MTSFTHPIRVQFGQVDAAGIVYYPRFFEMINETVQTWFREALDYDFFSIHNVHRNGVPTVDIHTRFHKPVRLEQVVDWHLDIVQLSSRSATLRICGMVEGALHVEAEVVLVHVTLSEEKGVIASPWPDAVHQRMKPFLAAEQGARAQRAGHQ